jgi:hypothetical protein
MRTLFEILKLGWNSHQRWYHFRDPIRLWKLIRDQWPSEYVPANIDDEDLFDKRLFE